MANTFNDVASMAQVIATSFDNMTVRPLRPNYIFDAVCQEKQWNLNRNPNKGDTMVFPVLNAFGADTAALDPTSTVITGGEVNVYTRRTVSLSLYGKHAVIDTLQMVPEAFVDAAGDVAFNMQDQAMNSLNVLARAAIDLNKYSNEVSGTLSGTYHYYGSSGTVGSMGPLKAVDVRSVVADMKGDNVKPFGDGNYVAIVDPVVSTQLRAETGNAAWRSAHLSGDSSVQQVFSGEIGIFENVRFVVNNEVSGASTNTVSSYFLGSEGCGKAIGKDVSVSMKPDLDGPHSNLATMRWNALVGYKIVRREAIRIIETTSGKL